MPQVSPFRDEGIELQPGNMYSAAGLEFNYLPSYDGRNERGAERNCLVLSHTMQTLMWKGIRQYLESKKKDVESHHNNHKIAF